MLNKKTNCRIYKIRNCCENYIYFLVKIMKNGFGFVIDPCYSLFTAIMLKIHNFSINYSSFSYINKYVRYRV